MRRRVPAPSSAPLADQGQPCQRCGQPTGNAQGDGPAAPFCADCAATLQPTAGAAPAPNLTLPELEQTLRQLSALGAFLEEEHHHAGSPPFGAALVGYARLQRGERPAEVRLDGDEAQHLAAALEANSRDAWPATQPYRGGSIAAWLLIHLSPTEGGRYRQRSWALLAGMVLKLPDRIGAWAELWTPPALRKAALGRHAGPFRDGQASILSAKPFLIARDAMLDADRADLWTAVDAVVVYRVPDPNHGGYVDVQRRCDATSPDGMLAELARAGDDLLADTYAAITARYIADGAPTDGIWVNVDDVLHDRGLEPIRRPGDRYSHGYRAEDRLAVGDHLAELERWAITGRLAAWQGQRSTRRQPILIDSTLLAITDRVYQLATDGRRVPLAIRCALGEYARHFLANGAGRQTALLMQAALRYDPYHEQAQKRLAYHLAFRWRLAAHDRDYAQPVTLARLFQEAHVPAGATQRKHPARTIAGWVKALDDLRRDGLLAGYELLPGPDTPLKGALEHWLAQRIRLTPPDHIPAHYQAIGAHNPRLRQIP